MGRKRRGEEKSGVREEKAGLKTQVEASMRPLWMWDLSVLPRQAAGAGHAALAGLCCSERLALKVFHRGSTDYSVGYWKKRGKASRPGGAFCTQQRRAVSRSLQEVLLALTCFFLLST